MKINGIDTSKGGTTNAMIEQLYWMGYDIVKSDTPNANFQCYEATITDKSGYATITIFFGGCDAAHITARIDKINGSHSWYYGKTLAQMLAVVRQCMGVYEFEKHTEEPKDEVKEEENTMKPTTAKIGDQVKVHGTIYTIAKILYADHFDPEGWMIEFEDTNGGYHYWKQYLDGGEFIPAVEDTTNTTTNNEEEDTTMKTTNVKIDLNTGIVKFELNGIIYTANPETKRYSKTVDGKTTRIGYVEYSKAHFDLQKSKQTAGDAQAELDKEPCRVEVNSDLYKPAVINQYGCVDCSKCNVMGCVHRNCMRRNPRSEGGLGECPRLDAIPQPEDVDPNDPENAYPDEAQDPELEQIMEETGLEASDAELERNIRNEQKKLDKAMEKLGYHRIDSEWNDIRYATDTHEVMAWNTVEEGLKWVKEQTKKPSKPRRSKDVAFEMDFGTSKVTLTAKQVDFLRELRKTEAYKEDENDMVVEDITITIGGQFEDKAMTVGAMISTLCEKHLGTRIKAKVGNRTMTLFGLTPSGKDIMNAIK